MRRKKIPTKISELVPDDKNFNTGNEFGNALIEKSLRKFGGARSILIDKNNRIIAGNKTIENAGAAGIEDIQIVESDGKRIIVVKRTDIDLNTKRGRELALADNATAKANIVLDAELIEAELSEATAVEWGVSQPKVQEDDYEPPPIEEVKTDIVRGDVFEITDGKLTHRLICGDSTKKEDVEKVLNGQKPDMIYADAPYGISVVSKDSKKVGGGGETQFKGYTGGGGATKAGKNKYVDSNEYSEIIGDETTETAKKFYALCLELKFKNLILWGGNYFSNFLPVTRCWFVWDKEMTGNFSEAEMAWTSFSKGGIRVFKYLWNGLQREGSRELEGVKRMHPTQKPVGLATMIFSRFDFCKNIFDGFLGSGTTMVAGHQLGRNVYGIEITPQYCQIIIDRMNKLDPELTFTKNGKPYKPVPFERSEKKGERK